MWFRFWALGWGCDNVHWNTFSIVFVHGLHIEVLVSSTLRCHNVMFCHAPAPTLPAVCHRLLFRRILSCPVLSSFVLCCTRACRCESHTAVPCFALHMQIHIPLIPMAHYHILFSLAHRCPTPWFVCTSTYMSHTMVVCLHLHNHVTPWKHHPHVGICSTVS